MNDSTINTRYAKALFKLAKEKKIMSQIEKDMKTVYDTFNSVDELVAIMHDPVLVTSKKSGVVKAVFDKNISEVSVSFLQLVVGNKRETYIKGISRDFIDLVKKDKGIKTVVITTAKEINKKQKEYISSLIKKELSSEIELTEIVNEEIIGGFIVRIDDTQYDSSVRAELKNYKKNLIETSFDK